MSKGLPKFKISEFPKYTHSFLHSLLVIVILLVASLTLDLSFKRDTVLGVTTTEIKQENLYSDEIAYWQDFLKQNRNYLPGWIELAKIQKLSGDIEGFQLALSQVQKINPNSTQIIELQRE